MTATAPTSNLSPLASAQSLRQRHSRLSPLRLGIYGLVSLGSHLLLLGLFRWAWQVQLTTQPVGSPIGIDFVEVDLSDGSFEGQIPDESVTASTPGGKLNAAQLNELIASGGEASAVENADVEELGQDKILADASSATNSTQVTVDPEGTAQTTVGETDQPRSWFPFGQSKETSGGSLLGDRPIPSPPVPDSGIFSPNNSDAPNLKEAEEAANSGIPSDANADIATPENSGNDSSPSNSDASTSPALTDTATSSNTDDSTPSAADSEIEATEEEPSQTGNSSGTSGGGGNSNSPGRPNDLPPNMSERPVSPDQTVQPDEATSEGNSNNSQPVSGAGDDDGSVVDSGGSSGPTGETDNGTGNGTAEGAAPAQSGGTDESAASPASGAASETGETSETNAGGDNDVATRLGANLVVDEVQSRALNTQDVFTRLPRPLGDPLSSGNQSVNSGRCATQLAGLTPASYGQPVQLRLAVDVRGDVFYVEGVGAQAQTAVGQAIACIAQEWPFEPAQRVIDEGGIEKVEDAGAVLFVTVTISRLE